MILLLLIFFWGHAPFGEGGDLSTLEISSKVFNYFSFGKNGYPIYKHSKNTVEPSPNNKFYTLPFNSFSPRGATCYVDRLAPEINLQNQLHIPVSMWPDKFLDAAWDFLVKHHDSNLKKSQVYMMPINRYHFSANTLNKHRQDLKLEEGWNSFVKQLDTLTMVMYVVEGTCEEKLKQFKNNPDMFRQAGFLFHYLVTTEIRNQMTLNVSTDSVTTTSFYTQLKQESHKQNIKGIEKGVMHVTSDDLTRFSKQIAEKITINSQIDVGYVTTKDTVNYASEIFNFIKSSTKEVSSDELPGKGFGSVFWNDKNTRPDHIASTLNDFERDANYSYLKEHKDSTKNKTTVVKGGGGGFNVSVPVPNSDVSLTGAASAQANTSSVTLNEKALCDLKEGKGDERLKKLVQWDGKTFIPRPMKVHRINTNNITKTLEFLSLNVQVHDVESALHSGMDLFTDVFPREDL